MDGCAVKVKQQATGAKVNQSRHIIAASYQILGELLQPLLLGLDFLQNKQG
jgi:hypothetical protein